MDGELTKKSKNRGSRQRRSGSLNFKKAKLVKKRGKYRNNDLKKCSRKAEKKKKEEEEKKNKSLPQQLHTWAR
ncbi:hypothetical protein SDJN02_21058, partial [Cucurbita argyrosperma subsp. argyrosperma]